MGPTVLVDHEPLRLFVCEFEPDDFDDRCPALLSLASCSVRSVSSHFRVMAGRGWLGSTPRIFQTQRGAVFVRAGWVITASACLRIMQAVYHDSSLKRPYGIARSTQIALSAFDCHSDTKAARQSISIRQQRLERPGVEPEQFEQPRVGS
jgi:hypothetical protein